MKSISEELIEKYKLHRRGNFPLLIFLTKDKFKALEDSMDNVDRISNETLNNKGYLNYILDFPISKFIAVLASPIEGTKVEAVVYDDVIKLHMQGKQPWKHLKN